MSPKKNYGRHAEDSHIIELYWQRDETAISLTSEKYGSFLFSSAYNILGDRLDCEECVNDTYLKVWNSIPPAKPKSLPAFISEIVRNAALDMYRKRTNKKRVPSELTVSMEELGDVIVDQIDMISEDDLGIVVRGFVDSLAARERFIFVGRYYFFRPVSDIARELGVSGSAVYKELSRLKDKMQKHLEKEGVGL